MTTLSNQVDAPQGHIDHLGAPTRGEVLAPNDPPLRPGLDSPTAPPAPGR